MDVCESSFRYLSIFKSIYFFAKYFFIHKNLAPCQLSAHKFNFLLSCDHLLLHSYISNLYTIDTITMDFQESRTIMHSSSYFQPLHSDLMSESFEEEPHDEVSNSIFREDVGTHSPPTIPRANPISCMEDSDDEDDECCYEIEQAMEDQPFMISPYPYSPCQEELEERQRLAKHFLLSGGEQQRPVVDYSCYFQPLPEWEDGVAQSFSTQQTDSCVLQMRLSSSPAHISDTDSMGECDNLSVTRPE